MNLVVRTFARLLRGLTHQIIKHSTHPQRHQQTLPSVSILEPVETYALVHNSNTPIRRYELSGKMNNVLGFVYFLQRENYWVAYQSILKADGWLNRFGIMVERSVNHLRTPNIG